MLVGLLIVPIAAYFMVGSDQVKPILDQSGVVGGASAYLSLFQNGDRPYTAVGNHLAACLGTWLLRYAAYSDPIYGGKESERVEKIQSNCYYMGNDFSGSSRGDRCHRACVSVPDDPWNRRKCFRRKRLYRDDHKNVYKDTNLPFIGGIFLCGILAAIMSTADSQLLVTASSVSKDIYKDILRPESDEKRY